jgi:hypothetical protein
MVPNSLRDPGLFLLSCSLLLSICLSYQCPRWLLPFQSSPAHNTYKSWRRTHMLSFLVTSPRLYGRNCFSCHCQNIITWQGTRKPGEVVFTLSSHIHSYTPRVLGPKKGRASSSHRNLLKNSFFQKCRKRWSRLIPSFCTAGCWMSQDRHLSLLAPILGLVQSLWFLCRWYLSPLVAERRPQGGSTWAPGSCSPGKSTWLIICSVQLPLDSENALVSQKKEVKTPENETVSGYFAIGHICANRQRTASKDIYSSNFIVNPVFVESLCISQCCILTSLF